jgi:hypothetical protein
LSRPFVAGASREDVEATPLSAPIEVTANQRGDREQLPPIEVFLDDEVFPAEEDSNELPPVEHFLDPLPAVGSFAPDADGALIDESAVAVDYASPTATGRPATETGWLVDDWQHYDWRGAATLGEGGESQASSDWARTDWEVGTPAARNKLSAAQAIANALDQIAQRIREGELSVPPSGAPLTNPGALAAKLAALLGVGR